MSHAPAPPAAAAVLVLLLPTGLIAALLECPGSLQQMLETVCLALPTLTGPAALVLRTPAEITHKLDRIVHKAASLNPRVVSQTNGQDCNTAAYYANTRASAILKLVCYLLLKAARPSGKRL